MSHCDRIMQQYQSKMARWTGVTPRRTLMLELYVDPELDVYQGIAVRRRF